MEEATHASIEKVEKEETLQEPKDEQEKALENPEQKPEEREQNPEPKIEKSEQNPEPEIAQNPETNIDQQTEQTTSSTSFLNNRTNFIFFDGLVKCFCNFYSAFGICIQDARLRTNY